MESRNQDGQSTVEFILTFVFGLSLIFFVLNSSMNYATGYLVHYATFMASRVYLTADSHTGNLGNVGPSLYGSEERAREAFNNYNLGIFNISEQNFKVNLVEDASDNTESLSVGTYTQFESSMDLIGQIAGQKKMQLVSESFLGKEPTRAECATRVCYAISGKNNCEEMDITLFDDGC